MCKVWVELINGRVIDAKPKRLLKGHWTLCVDCGINKVKGYKTLKGLTKSLKEVKCPS